MINNFVFIFIAALAVLIGAVAYLFYRVRLAGCKANELYSIGINALRKLDERLTAADAELRQQLNGLDCQIEAESEHLNACVASLKAEISALKELDITRGHADEERAEELKRIKNELEELNRVFNDLVQDYLAQEAEAASAAARAEEAFTDGLNGIINYGENIAKLNKEGLNGRQ